MAASEVPPQPQGEERSAASAELLTSAQISEEVSRLIGPFERLTGELDELFVCVICAQPFSNPVATQCGHTFCPECLAEWMKKQNTCPICRQIVTPRTVLQPVLLREAIDKYRQLKPAVETVQQYVNRLQHHVRSAQSDLVREKTAAQAQLQRLQDAESKTAELRREVDAAQAQKQMDEERLRELHAQLEQMATRLREADAAKAALAERAQIEASRAQPPPQQPPAAAATAVQQSPQSQQQHHGIWGTLSKLGAAASDLIARQQQSWTAGHAMPAIDSYKLKELRGSHADSLVRRAVLKKAGSAEVALKRVELGIPPRPVSPATSSLQQPAGTEDWLPDQAVAHAAEAYVLANTDHECIVRLSGVVRDPASRGSAFFMELPFYEFDLDWAIREKLVGKLQATDVAVQLVRAVAYLHSRGIAHRDICPENVLLRSSLEPDPRSPSCGIVLAGFGQTCSGPHCSRPPRVLGAYHAPECFAVPSDWASMDWFAVDQWAVGCVLGELLLGKPLFNMRALRRLAVSGSVPRQEPCEIATVPIMRFVCATGFAGIGELLPSAPTNAVEFLQLLLVRDPRRRLSSSSALHNRFVSPSAESATPPLTGSRRLPIPMDNDSIRNFIQERWKGLLM